MSPHGGGSRDQARPRTPDALTAAVVTAWAHRATAVAQESQDLVDALNVFPVPDADTGTNVLLTLRAAADALSLLPAHADAVQATRAAADGAVRGARGNSGLLVSQALAALADVAAQAPDPTGLRPVELVHAYEHMAAQTRAAVSRPVEGTLLTVAHDAARAARAALDASDAAHPVTLASLTACAALGAQESVVETAGLGHGPVDAGGAALMLMLTALSDVVAGEGPGLTGVAQQMLTDLAVGGVPHGASGPGGEGLSTGEFEVMYLLEATAAQADEVRSALERVGDSVGVVGTTDALGVGLYQVHVHTDTPRAALPRTGRARQVCVHHLHRSALVQDAPTDEPPLPGGQPWDHPAAPAGGARVVSLESLAARRAQREERRAHAVRTHPSQVRADQPGPHPAHPLPAAHAHRHGDRVGVIACTRAPGLIEQLARTGAVVVLDPEREGVVRAAGDLGVTQVLVLPCDPGAAAQAHEAARFLQARSAVSSVSGPPGSGAGSTHDATTPVQLLVAETDDEARVLAAAVAVAGQAATEALSDVAGRAARAAASLRTLALAGPEAEADAVATTLTRALRHGDELVTVIVGRDAGPDVGALVNSALASASGAGAPEGVEVVVHAGGQPSPDVLVAIE